MSTGFLKPSISIDDGSLETAVTNYMRARMAKDTDALLGLMVVGDLPTRERESSFYQRTLPAETLLSYRVMAAKELEGEPGVTQVFTAVVLQVRGQCYEDVLTTRWWKAAVGWRVLPAGGVEAVF